MCPNRLGGMMQPAKAAHGAFLARPSWGPRKAGRLCGERRSSVVIELSCLHGSERYAACFDEVVARRARFPTCGVIRVAGYSVVWDYDPTPISPKEHQKERCGHYSAAALLHYVLWCASEYSVVGRISHRSSMITLEQTFFNDASEYLFPR